MNIEDHIKLFGMSSGLAERDLDKIESTYRIDLVREPAEPKDEEYYPQFSHALRSEASDMAAHYELFYCLERSIRSLIAETLEAAHGEIWWDKCVPESIKENAQANMRKEVDAGMTPRSEHELDYTSFGELGEIVRSNIQDFDSIFSSLKAFNKIMTNLNMLRAPIAHCCPLAEDEVVRLRLTLRDWFRLME